MFQWQRLSSHYQCLLTSLPVSLPCVLLCLSASLPYTKAFLSCSLALTRPTALLPAVMYQCTPAPSPGRHINHTSPYCILNGLKLNRKFASLFPLPYPSRWVKGHLSPPLLPPRSIKSPWGQQPYRWVDGVVMESLRPLSTASGEGGNTSSYS